MSAGEREVLDAFRAAAFSVTKLFKTSSSAVTKARADGYQDCLEDLLAFLDKEGLGLAESEVVRIRRWAQDRTKERDTISQSVESEDEVEKPEVASSPVMQRASSPQQPPAVRNEVQMTEHTPPVVPRRQSVSPTAEDGIVVPTLDSFTFQANVPYPQETPISLANLKLSDSQPNTGPSSRHGPNSTRTSRGRNGRPPPRAPAPRAGQKRKIDIDEFFHVDLTNGKDIFGHGKRSRLN